MIAILPKDNTTYFLYDIISNLEIEIIDPHFLSSESLFDKIRSHPKSSSIIYLGHGTASEINTNTGPDTSIDAYAAKKMFYQRKIIFISCYSSTFITAIKEKIEVGIGFGNIPSSIEELSKRKRENYYQESSDAINLFKGFVVDIFKSSFHESVAFNHVYIDLYSAIRLRINKKLSFCSLSKERTYRLVGELLFELKNEMRLFGDSKLPA